MQKKDTQIGEMSIFDIKDSVIVITGGYGVLGSNVAQHIVASGAKVAILGRDEEKAKTFAKKISDTNAIGLKANVLDEENLFSVEENILKT